MIRSCREVKLNARPAFVMFAHKYYFEGPCRMSGGETLEPGFDTVVNGRIMGDMMDTLRQTLPDYINIMDPVSVEVTCDWDIKEEYFETLLQDQDDVDVYLAMNTFGADMVFNEFCLRARKPICIIPNVWNPVKSGMLFAENIDPICELTWEDTIKHLQVLRARKALRESNLLLVPRFNYDIPVAGATDSFINLRAVTEKMGIHFRTVNAHEILDMMHPLTPEGNHTTPGRITPNITEEEIAELEDVADQLMAGAEVVDVEKDKLVKSLIAHRVIQKNMDLYDCDGVVIPCPDICSTRRMNQEQFTFCLCHSLNLELGLASACEYDVASAVTMLAEIVISNKAPYMGNTLPLVFNDQKSLNRQLTKLVPEEDIGELAGMDNLYAVSHSTPHRKFRGIDGPDNSYGLKHFAYDQEFGAVMRHNFNEDAGQVITFAKFSGDLKRMLIGRGTIVKSFGYDLNNCNGGFIFQVDDQKKVYHEQCRAGLHAPLIFGDYAEPLKMLAESYDIEPVLV
ncbi:MAG: fucose isomerase [Oscillospiraceae bacterium]|nr:fucose isomerase [Oscillospiraceae bacterium]